jgi:hypothetical protein
MPKQLHPESRTRLAKRFLTIDEFADLNGHFPANDLRKNAAPRNSVRCEFRTPPNPG